MSAPACRSSWQHFSFPALQQSLGMEAATVLVRRHSTALPPHAKGCSARPCCPDVEMSSRALYTPLAGCCPATELPHQLTPSCKLKVCLTLSHSLLFLLVSFSLLSLVYHYSTLPGVRFQQVSRAFSCAKIGCIPEPPGKDP